MKRIVVFAVGVFVGAVSLLYFQQYDFATPNAELVTRVAPSRQYVLASVVPGSDTAKGASALAQLDSARTLEEPGAQTTPTDQAPKHSGKLLIPVTGITAAQLSDTFNDKRGTDRIHEALDIIAPLKTPVVAVDNGKVVKLFNSVAGGLTVYQYDPSGTFAYYYAHLDSYADELAEGQELKRGDLLGYVGTSGNANPLSPHLHFAIFLLGPEKQWWTGTAINPLPLFER